MNRRVILGTALFFLTAGCTPPIPVYGLRPEYPELRRSSFDGSKAIVEVDSLQPTLKWESFPTPRDRDADMEKILARIGTVTYDLQIWRTVPGYRPVELVYERRGIEHPWHRVESPLKPAARYVWTVRARFGLDGDWRVTEWGKIKGENNRRLDTIPDPDYYPFETPAE